MMHIVVMDPTIHPWETDFEQAILFEYSIGDRREWPVDFREVALDKARQAWSDGRGNMYKHLLAPVTLKSGDVAFYGSFEHDGVVVAASGVEGWYDVLVCGWVAIAFHQLAQAWYQEFKATNPMTPRIP